MPKATAVDPKVRWTLTLVGLTVLVVIALAIGSYISRISEDGQLTSAISADERLITIDGRTMLVGPEALPQAMSSWLHSRKEKSLSFELSDKSFVANSSAPSSITLGRISQVASLVKASPAVTVHIVQPSSFDNIAIQRLDEQRAVRLRNALVSTGINGSQVRIEGETGDRPTADSPYLSVLLTK